MRKVGYVVGIIVRHVVGLSIQKNGSCYWSVLGCIIGKKVGHVVGLGVLVGCVI